MNDIIITTGNLNYQYAVVDCIFAFDQAIEGFFSGTDPHLAFNGVKEKLKQHCAELGGHAVINTHFEYRSAETAGVFGSKCVIEIFAYGTVVQFLQN